MLDGNTIDEVDVAGGRRRALRWGLGLLCLLLLGKLLLILSYLFFECLLCARLLFK